MQEKLDAAPLEESAYKAPATVQIDTFGSDTFEVEVDAEVVIPNVTKYPVAEIEKRYFTPEWEKNLMLTMADGKPVYSCETEIPQTKETVLKEVTTLQEMLTNPEAQFTEGMSEDNQKALIEVWKKDSDSTLMMIPAWTFFGNTIQTYDEAQPGDYNLDENTEYTEETPGYRYLILNAVDGSVINPLPGY